MRPLASLIGVLMAAYVRLVAATCRVTGGPPTQAQVVLAFWHEYNLAAAIAAWRLRRAHRHVSFSTQTFRGEVMNAMLAAWYGVPVVMVTGDDVAVEQQKETAPGVRGVTVKRAINSRAVELRPLTEARREIETAATEAVRAAKKPQAERAPAYTVRMEFRDPTIPEVATAFREVRLVSPYVVEFTRDNMPDAYRLIRVLYRFINTN